MAKISAHVFVDPRIAHLPAAKAVVETLGLIDSLLELPPRPPVELQISGSRRVQGEYIYQADRPDRPVALRISRFAPCPRLTAAHEIGHYLDNQWLHALKRDFASMYEPDFDDLRTKWNQCEYMKSIVVTLDRHRSRVRPEMITFLRSLLQNHEMWARSFAQWLVVRTRNQQLRNELSQRQIKFGWLAESRYTPYWHDHDFLPIYIAVEFLLKKRGLLC